jgi:hypothetical protein
VKHLQSGTLLCVGNNIQNQLWLKSGPWIDNNQMLHQYIDHPTALNQEGYWLPSAMCL